MTIVIKAFQIYNDKIEDLLNSNKNLQLKLEKKTSLPEGLKNEEICDITKANDIIHKIQFCSSRTPTEQNFQSSRSHVFYVIEVNKYQKKKAKPNNFYAQTSIETSAENPTTTKFCIVDLAGSEKPSRGGLTGAEFSEGCKINQSLLSLYQCLQAIKNCSEYVPYRDCKLTHIQFENFNTVKNVIMLANIKSDNEGLEETLRVQEYASNSTKLNLSGFRTKCKLEEEKLTKAVNDKLLEDQQNKLVRKRSASTSNKQNLNLFGNKNYIDADKSSSNKSSAKNRDDRFDLLKLGITKQVEETGKQTKRLTKIRDLNKKNMKNESQDNEDAIDDCYNFLDQEKDKLINDAYDPMYFLKFSNQQREHIRESKSRQDTSSRNPSSKSNNRYSNYENGCGADFSSSHRNSLFNLLTDGNDPKGVNDLNTYINKPDFIEKKEKKYAFTSVTAGIEQGDLYTNCIIQDHKAQPFFSDNSDLKVENSSSNKMIEEKTEALGNNVQKSLSGSQTSYQAPKPPRRKSKGSTSSNKNLCASIIEKNSPSYKVVTSSSSKEGKEVQEHLENINLFVQEGAKDAGFFLSQDPNGSQADSQNQPDRVIKYIVGGGNKTLNTSKQKKDSKEKIRNFLEMKMLQNMQEKINHTNQVASFNISNNNNNDDVQMSFSSPIHVIDADQDVDYCNIDSENEDDENYSKKKEGYVVKKKSLDSSPIEVQPEFR